MMNFTNDEMNLMCIYQSDSRSGLIAALTEMRGYLPAISGEPPHPRNQTKRPHTQSFLYHGKVIG